MTFLEDDKMTKSYYYTDSNGNSKPLTGALLREKYAEDLREEFHFWTPNDSQTTYYFSELDGYYILAETMVKKRAQEELEHRATKNMISEILSHLRNKSYEKREDVNPRFLPLKNGIYDISKQKFHTHEAYINEKGDLLEKDKYEVLSDTEKRDFQPYYKRLHYFRTLEISYEENAECSEYERFLDDLMLNPDGTINEPGKDTLWKFTGNLFNRVPNERWINLFIGPPKSGKSTYLEAQQRLLGGELCTHESFEDIINDPHATAELKESWFNVCSEVRQIKVDTGNAFVRLTGGEKVSGHQKFGQRQKFYVLCKFGFSMNEIPEIEDPSGAFASRLILLDFSNVFDGEKKIEKKELFSRILSEKERSGIFNKAMVYLRKIQSGEDYIRVPMSEMQRLLLERSNSVVAFMENMVISSPECVHKKDAIWARYSSFCKEGFETKPGEKKKQRTQETETKFWRDMKARYGAEFLDQKLTIGSGRAPCWKGLKVDGVEDVSGVQKNIRVIGNADEKQRKLMDTEISDIVKLNHGHPGHS